MREINWNEKSGSYIYREDRTGFADRFIPKLFDFSNSLCRYVLTSLTDFAFGHYSIGEGYATIGGGRIGNKLYYGVSFCSPEDNFSKKLGILYAKHNLAGDQSGHMRGVFIISDEISDEPPTIILQKAVASHLDKMRRGRRPQWAKNQHVEFRGRPKIKTTPKVRREVLSDEESSHLPSSTFTF